MSLQSWARPCLQVQGQCEGFYITGVYIYIYMYSYTATAPHVTPVSQNTHLDGRPESAAEAITESVTAWTASDAGEPLSGASPPPTQELQTPQPHHHPHNRRHPLPQSPIRFQA